MTDLPKTPPEPPCALLVLCVECNNGVEVPLPTDRDALARLLAQRSWFASVLSPPSPDPAATMLLGALCGECAQRVFPPEVLKVAEEQRQKLVQGTR